MFQQASRELEAALSAPVISLTDTAQPHQHIQR